MTQMGTCKKCGQSYSMERLLITASGHLCAGCNASNELDTTERNATLTMMFSPVAAGILSWGLWCVPVVNIIAPGLAGLVAIWRSIEAFRWFVDLSRRKASPVPDWHQAMLIVGGVLGLLLGVPTVLLQVIVFLGVGLSTVFGG